MRQSRNMVVLNAIAVVRRRLGGLPKSRVREQLDAQLRDCAQEAHQWVESPPTRPNLDALMARLLGIHVEVAKLEHVSLCENGSTAG